LAAHAGHRRVHFALAETFSGVAVVSVGAAISGFNGWLLLQSDKALPAWVRAMCREVHSAANLCPLLPTSPETFRTVTLSLLLAGLVLAAMGFVTLCNWFLDRR